MNNEEKLVNIINKMITLCEPIKLSEFNCIIKAKDVDSLRKAELNDSEIGLARYGKENEGISTLSIIATITDILVQKRLAFGVDDNGLITNVKFVWHTLLRATRDLLEEHSERKLWKTI